MAFADITDSNTYKLIEGATSIINPKSASEIEVGLQSGKMILSKDDVQQSVSALKDLRRKYSTQLTDYTAKLSATYRVAYDVSTGKYVLTEKE